LSDFSVLSLILIQTFFTYVVVVTDHLTKSLSS